MNKKNQQIVSTKEPTEPKRARGRPRIYRSAAERQAAYRARQKAAGKRLISRYVLDVRNKSQPLHSDIIDLSEANKKAQKNRTKS